MTPGLVIAAPASGTGKTTVMIGLLRAFRDAGLAVQPFKAGPDYIDPAFHSAASGRTSYNLDTWAMDAGLLSAIVATREGADLAVAEGAMGLFDGAAASGPQGNGSTADLAARTGWPVVLVIDASGQAQTAGAVALGHARFRPDVTVAGVILNRVASARHARLAEDGIRAAGLTLFGTVPKHAFALPGRHLGLVQAREQPDLEAQIAALGRLVADSIDLTAIRSAAASGADGPAMPLPCPPGQRIALASDAAFSFAYPHLVEGWRRAGAEILHFSPLADEPPAPVADVVWLPGGYPELHAGRLAAAHRFRAGLAAHAESRPVHGECGGYMALGTGLIDQAGVRHAMAGLLGLVADFQHRRLHLGYRRATLLAPIPGHQAGATLCGHEFHYSTIAEQPDPPLARVVDADGAEVADTGACRGRVSGSFFHLIAAAA